MDKFISSKWTGLAFDILNLGLLANCFWGSGSLYSQILSVIYWGLRSVNSFQLKETEVLQDKLIDAYSAYIEKYT